MFKRSWKFFWQRRFRGWDDSELWSLDVTIAKYILPRLQRFHKTHVGYPCGLTEEKWNSILLEMIYSFQVCADDSIFNGDVDNERLQNGLELFGEYFNYLWI